MANVASLPKRNRRFIFDQVHAAWIRITEDNVLTMFEQVEFSELLSGACQFAVALDTTHLVCQALPRATDPEHVGELVAMQQATMAVLPDAKDAA